jgi:hypothetical protein
MVAADRTGHDRDRHRSLGEPVQMSTGYLSILGILLILVAIPFGLMLAPLVIGVVLVWYGLRRLEGAVERPTGEPA